MTGHETRDHSTYTHTRAYVNTGVHMCTCTRVYAHIHTRMRTHWHGPLLSLRQVVSAPSCSGLTLTVGLCPCPHMATLAPSAMLCAVSRWADLILREQMSLTAALSPGPAFPAALRRTQHGGLRPAHNQREPLRAHLLLLTEHTSTLGSPGRMPSESPPLLPAASLLPCLSVPSS